MANTGGHVNVASDSHEEHDHVEYRKRVATHADGNSVSYEDTDFIASESPIVLDVFTDLARAGHKGYFVNDGPGDIQVEVSHDSTNYGGIHTLHGGDILVLDDLNVRRIRLTHVDDMAYRALIA